MTQEEIQERNKQIALMLGLKPLKKPYEGAFTSDENTFNSFRIFFNGLLEDESWYAYPKFHSDWNWLMEAVEFINNTHNQDNPYRDLHYTMGSLLHGGWWKNTKIPRRLLSNIEELFIAVSDFAKLYNEGKI